MQKSTMIKKETAHKNRQWFMIDARGAVLGKLAEQVANLLRGKHKADFTPNVDCGDYVIVYHANEIILTGNKLEKENWYTHSQYIGGLRTRSGKIMKEKYAEEWLTTAVKGMLPKNRLANRMITKLHVFGGEVTKDFAAQKPTVLTAKGVRE